MATIARDQVDGWYGFRVVDGSEVGRAHPGCKAGMPVFVARKRMDAPYPDVEVLLPLSAEVCAAWQIGGFGAMANRIFPLLNAEVEILLARDEPAVLGSLN